MFKCSGNMAGRTDRFCGANLRMLCMIIGYLHLASSVADITYHLLTVAIVTDGLQCDPSIDRLKRVMDMTYLEPILLVINIGTHGFYPYPRVARDPYSMYIENMAIQSEPRCYPGMLHVSSVDVLNFFINMIWFRIVVSYIGGLHKRNPEPMQMFFTLSIVKLLMQILYFGYLPGYSDNATYETYWFLKLLDVLLALFFLVIIRKYAQFLKAEKASQNIEKPPPYMELVGTFQIPSPSRRLENNEAIIDFKEVNIVKEKDVETKQVV